LKKEFARSSPITVRVGDFNPKFRQFEGRREARLNFYKHLIFDLDDTLLDTSGALIPAAARRAVEAMIRATENETTEASSQDPQVWLAKRLDILAKDPRADVWLRLASGDDEIADIGRRAFFTHPIEQVPDAAMRLTEGALETLEWSRTRATLHLVTAGDAPTQNKKIERLGISRFFETIQIVDATHSAAGPHRKLDAFRKTKESDPTQTAEAFLSIGNRVDTDLGPAKILGWQTAWVRYGEHSNLLPQRPEEIPDFEVASLANLLSIWRQKFEA
jgi:putative hydrolase of the HAD superfamily